MGSPLAAPHVVPLYIELKNCVFYDNLKHLGKFIWLHNTIYFLILRKKVSHSIFKPSVQ